MKEKKREVGTYTHLSARNGGEDKGGNQNLFHCFHIGSLIVLYFLQFKDLSPYSYFIPYL